MFSLIKNAWDATTGDNMYILTLEGEISGIIKKTGLRQDFDTCKLVLTRKISLRSMRSKTRYYLKAIKKIIIHTLLRLDNSLRLFWKPLIQQYYSNYPIKWQDTLWYRFHSLKLYTVLDIQLQWSYAIPTVSYSMKLFMDFYLPLIHLVLPESHLSSQSNYSAYSEN